MHAAGGVGPGTSQGGYPGNPPPGMAPLSPPVGMGGAHMTAPNKHLPPLPGQNGAPSPHHSIGGGPQSHHGGSNDHLEPHKSRADMMELSDLHHPSCKLNQSRQGSFDDHGGDPDGDGLDDR